MSEALVGIKGLANECRLLSEENEIGLPNVVTQSLSKGEENDIEEK